MTDREKMENILTQCNGSFEDIIFSYLNNYYDDFSASRINDLIASLNEDYLYHKINDLENIKCISKERAFYLKTFLEGKMYTTEEEAIRHIPIQINHAEAIIDACKKK